MTVILFVSTYLFGQLDLRLPLGPAERVKLCFSLARLFVPAGVEFEPKRILAALLDVALHDFFASVLIPSLRRTRTST